MRILCKGFNLYNQLNGTEICVLDFQTTFEFDGIEHFQLGHTFSLILTNNVLKLYCNLANKSCIEHPNIGKIKQVTVSDEVILILNETGNLFKAAINDWQIKPVPKFTVDNNQIKIISSNSKLNVAYLDNGYIYNIPEKLDFVNRNIIDVKTGREHCVLLDKLGNVYTFGAGSRGQLGTGLLEEQTNPLLVQALAGIKIIKIAAGGWHSAAVSEDGDLYTWGWNGNGQLGLGASASGDKHTVSVMATSHVIDIEGSDENHVVQVACGSKHTIVLLDTNILFGCGWNKYKQLKNEDQEEYHAFVQIGDFSEECVDKIVCGPWNSAVICK